jgi:hypothetical protein
LEKLLLARDAGCLPLIGEFKIHLKRLHIGQTKRLAIEDLALVSADNGGRCTGSARRQNFIRRLLDKDACRRRQEKNGREHRH